MKGQIRRENAINPHKTVPMTFFTSTGHYVRRQSVLVNRRRVAYYLCMIEQTYRYIMAVDGVRSGRPIVEGTRIGVHDVVGLYINGSTVDDITRELPLLSRAQVYECLSYYEDHKADIELWVAEQMADDEETR